jgi:hypothetical protein
VDRGKRRRYRADPSEEPWWRAGVPLLTGMRTVPRNLRDSVIRAALLASAILFLALGLIAVVVVVIRLLFD